MKLSRKFDRFRREHEEILRFLNVWDRALNLVAEKDEEKRLRGLAQLRVMKVQLRDILQHCRAEEREIESPFRLYLDDGELERLKVEHEGLERANSDFQRELQFADVLRTDELVHLGRQLLAALRRHIASEEALLEQIREGSAAEENVLLKYTSPGE